jgi:hypothetical protein
MSSKWILAPTALIATSFLLAAHAVGKDEKVNYPKAACVDSEGATTGFFCRPLSPKNKPIAACDNRRRSDVSACRSQTADRYCVSRGFIRSISYRTDTGDSLSEVVCERGAVLAATDEWLPMFDTNLLGYDLREFGLRAGQDWKACKAACDGDSQCKGWTVSPADRSYNAFGTCYLKNDTPPPNVEVGLISGIKGAPSSKAKTKR